MKRETLEQLGLTEEQINNVMAEHGKSVQSMKSDLESAQIKNDEYAKQVAKFDDQIKSLKKAAKDNEVISEQLDLIKQAREKEKAEFEQRLTAQTFEFALDTALRDYSARNNKAVRSLLDLESIKLENGQLVGLNEQIEKLQQTDDYLFSNTDVIKGNSPRGARKINEPTFNGKNPYAADTFNLTEQYKLEETNPELAAKLEAAAQN